MTLSLLPRLLVICGPTASGKSALAVQLAKAVQGEIINADSMQIYQGMNIGTAKPTLAQMAGIRHHLIDIVDPVTSFSAADFALAADRAIADIQQRGKRVIIVGGTGLYIKALLKGLVDSPAGDPAMRQQLHLEAEKYGNEVLYGRLKNVDPELAATLHHNNLVRIIRALEVYYHTGIPLSRYQQDHGFAAQRYQALQIGIEVERTTLYERIEKRVEQMLNDGLVQEVAALLAAGYGRELKAMRAIGYKESAAFLTGEGTLAEAERLIKRDTRHYAKRQLTWFRADPDILWFEYPEKFATIEQLAIDFFHRGEA